MRALRTTTFLLLLVGAATALPAGAAANLTCGGRPVTVRIGAGQQPTDGDDVILGTNGSDIIRSGRGADIICGRGGNDRLFGGRGADVVYGQKGDDGLHGGLGNDRLYGGVGGDYTGGEEGNDFCDLGPVDDGNEGDPSCETGNGAPGH